MNRYLCELIGTFFLVLTIGCSVLPGSKIGGLAPLAIGSALMVMVYAGGHISGGHYNPAVTLGVWLRGKCSTADVIPYMIAQALGAAAAAFASLHVRPEAASPLIPAVEQMLLVEFLFTFALVYVVLNVATAKGTAGNSYFGLAIGFTVLVGAFAVGDVSLGAFNPAVAVGLSIMNMVGWTHLWVYLVANFAGGALAAIVFRLLNRDDKAS